MFCAAHPERFILSSLNHSALFGSRTRPATALARSLVFPGALLGAFLGVVAGSSPAAAADPAETVDAGEVFEFRARARFLSAEKKREAAERVVLPPHDGPGDRAAVLAYLNTRAASWMIRKRWAIEEAERSYLKIFGLILPPAPPPPSRPPPPPRPGAIGLLGGDPNAPTAPWGTDAQNNPFLKQWPGAVTSPRWFIAAAARVGQLWADYAHALRTMPIPSAGDGSKSWQAELRGAYFLTLLDGPEAHKLHAKEAFAACLRWSIEYRQFDPVSLTCERWLARNYSAEYFTIEELHAWPAWAHPLDVRGAALRLGTVGRPAIPAWLSPP